MLLNGFYQKLNDLKYNLFSYYNIFIIGFDILKPPKGVRISIEVDSHHLGKKMAALLRFIPKPTLRFSCRQIENSKPMNQKRKDHVIYPSAFSHRSTCSNPLVKSTIGSYLRRVFAFSMDTVF